MASKTKMKLPKSHREEIRKYLQVSKEKNTVELALNDRHEQSDDVDGPNNVDVEDGADKFPFGWFDIICLVASIIFYLSDVGTDSWLAWNYYRKDQTWYFILTVSFMCVPSIVMNICSFCWFFADYKAYRTREKWGHSWMFWFFLHIVFCILQLGPVLRYATVIYYGRKCKKLSGKEKQMFYGLMLEEDKDSCMLRLFECSMEAGPQLTLQLYIMVTQNDQGTMDTFQLMVQVISVLTSWFGMSWSHVSYHRALRRSRDDKLDMTMFGTILYFAWRLFEILSRVLALFFFANQFTFWVFLATFVHWMLMTIWFSVQRIGQERMFHNACLDFGFDMVCGAVSIFSFFNVKDGHSRHRCLVFYVLIYMENAAFVLLWFFFTKDMTAWFHFPALFAVLIGFFVGVAFQLVYYVMYHPSGNIKLCLPNEEFEHSVCFHPLKKRHRDNGDGPLPFEGGEDMCSRPSSSAGGKLLSRNS